MAFIIFIFALVFSLSNQARPTLETLSYAVIFGACFFLAGLIAFIMGVQKFLGASAYIINDNFLTVRHAFGKTKIPFDAVEYVSKDTIRRIVHTSRTRGNLITMSVSFVNSKEKDLKVSSSFLPTLNGLFISVGDGECVLLQMRNKNLIALTPEDPEEMFKVLLAHMSSRTP